MVRSLMSLLTVLAVASSACKKSENKPATSGSGSAGSSAITSDNIQIFVDDQPAGTLAPAQLALWPRLDTLVPMAARRIGTWQEIRVTTKAGTSTIGQPSTSYPDMVAALFPGDGGKPAFGMFDPVEHAKKGKPALAHQNVTEIHLVLAKGNGRGENDHQGGEATDPSALKLTIKTAKGEIAIDGAKLLALAREPQPGHADGDGGKGWKLQLLLEQAGIKGYERLLLTDSKGTNLTLEKQDLDPASAVPFVKLNRQGTLRFRVFRKQGDTWQPGSDLRGLTTVEILK